ncbi:MAG: hypothetical protein ACR2JQ_12735 [Mycobacteriales bacterium]
MRPQDLLWRAMSCAAAAIGRVRARGSERGDVPGWVMVTLMSAILVVAILVPFKSQVVPAIQQAVDKVINAG